MEQKQKSSKEKLTRTCAGCNQKQNKYTLIRIVKSPDGTVSIDPSGKANGRGAYLCRNLTCLQQAKKNKAAQPSFKNGGSGGDLRSIGGTH